MKSSIRNINLKKRAADGVSAAEVLAANGLRRAANDRRKRNR